MFTKTMKTLRTSIIPRATNSSKKKTGRRKDFMKSRRSQDENLKKSLSAIVQDERVRLSTIWDSHKSFFSNDDEAEKENENLVEGELVIDDTDLKNTNDFFESK